MTTTATEVEDKRDKAAAGVAYFANGESLIRAISNGLIFSGDDRTLPVLGCQEFEFDGSRLQISTTDRYRLCIETVELDPQINHEGQPAFRFLLERAAAKDLLAGLKANKRDKILLRTVDTGHTRPAVEVQFYSGSRRYETYDGTFPSVRQLIPDVDKRTAVDEIGFTYPYLADLGKVQTGSRTRHVRIWTYGPNKPTRIDYLEGPTRTRGADRRR